MVPKVTSALRALGDGSTAERSIIADGRPQQALHRALHEGGGEIRLYGVALENDRRHRELTQLREAAEADRRSLLTRLGREDISGAVGAIGEIAD